MNIIYADVGGTKTHLALAEVQQGHVDTLFDKRYASNSFETFDALLEVFFKDIGDRRDISKACFAVAGPVQSHPGEQTAKITNLPWALSSTSLKANYNIDDVILINDFEAVAYGVLALNDDEIVTAQKGLKQEKGNIAVVGAGTGLGVAFIVYDDKQPRIVATEGGHVDFAARTPIEAEFCQWLRQRYGHASYERVLSGPGLVDLYRFFSERAHEHQSIDRDGAAISQGAEKGDELCQRTLTTFYDIYAAFASNVALTTMARGGVYIAGGIAAKTYPMVDRQRFSHHFCDKGKMAALTKNIPVHVVLNEQIGLQGACNKLLLS